MSQLASRFRHVFFRIQNPLQRLEALKHVLEDERARIRREFEAGATASASAASLTDLVDALLRSHLEARMNAVPAAWEIALVAVGGYGRREMCPKSDVDLLILTPPKPSAAVSAEIEQMLYPLWDLGFVLGQAVRSVNDCRKASESDVETYTAFLQERFLGGNFELYREFANFVGERPNRRRLNNLVQMKLAERDKRLATQGKLAQMLEPNLKEGRGCLRDLHSLVWLAGIQHGARGLEDLVRHGIASPEELDDLRAANEFLLRARIALHNVSGQKSDRLGFAEQIDVAKALGYHDNDRQKGVEHFHHVSSIAAAGMFEGMFREDMFEEAENLDHPYFSTKHDSEKIVRSEIKGAWRVYRPGLVVGDSKTGEMDKIDGPYYFFKLIQRMRQMLPPWMPTIGIEGGRINIVPVDYVVDALDHIAHLANHDRKCFHLVDPEPMRVGDVLNTFATAAHAPSMTLRVNAALLGFIPRGLKKSLMALTPVRRIRNAVMKDLGLPDDILDFVNYPTRFDCRDALKALQGSGIACPALRDYAWVLWDYWERHLDPDLFIDRTLRGQVAGKVVLITGGSSGIGLAAARKIAAAGAITIVCGRGEEKLAEAREVVAADGHELVTFSVDLASIEDCDRMVKWLVETYGGVDVLVNNAGRSIRRGIEGSYERFHDYERCMQLNYFGALRTTIGLLPKMIEKRSGQVINISSIGVLTNAPRFSAYVASKAALDAWTRCAASEFADVGLKFTTINMPLVRTPMIAPTKLYNSVPTLSPEEAADMIVDAIVHKPVQIATRLGITGQVLHAVMPRVAQIIMNTSFRMFPDSDAARGPKDGGKPPQLSADQIAFQQLMRGIHF